MQKKEALLKLYNQINMNKHSPQLLILSEELSQTTLTYRIKHKLPNNYHTNITHTCTFTINTSVSVQKDKNTHSTKDKTLSILHTEGQFALNYTFYIIKSFSNSVLKLQSPS